MVWWIRVGFQAFLGCKAELTPLSFTQITNAT